MEWKKSVMDRLFAISHQVQLKQSRVPKPVPCWQGSHSMVEEVKMRTRNSGDREKLSQHLSELKDKESEIRLQIKNLQEEAVNGHRRWPKA